MFTPIPDSLHIILNGEDRQQFLDNCNLTIHRSDLGAWDHESNFVKAKFLRQKCYIEKEIIEEKDYLEGIENENSYLYSSNSKGYYKLKITVAGMPTSCYPYVNFDNFNIGAAYKGKKQPKIVPGGVVLSEIDFTIKKV